MDIILNFLSSNTNEASYIVAAFIGGLAHFLKKSIKGETTVEIHEWFGPANLQASLYTFIMFFFVVAGSLGGGVIDSNTSFWVALYTGFLTGYTIDSSFNSDGKIPPIAEQQAITKPYHSEIQEHHIDQAVQSVIGPKVTETPTTLITPQTQKLKVVIKQ
jgi:uncharacterized protein YgiB involved in biofilm formation